MYDDNVCIWGELKQCTCTYTFHFQDGEDSASHQHAQRDGENENKRQRQRESTHLHHPQDNQTHELDQSEEMHPQRPHLHKRQHVSMH